MEDQQRQGGALAAALRQASVRPWPDENGDYYAVRTLEDWWYAYRKHGFEAWVPAPRSDQGQSRVLDAATAAWVLEQVTQNPQVPLKVLYAPGRQAGRSLPSITVLYRYLRRQGLDRKSLRSGRLETGPTKACEAPQVNDLWRVDFSPGPTLSANGKSQVTQWAVLIDDPSRLIPFAAYYPQAHTEAFHHALKEAILRRGLPRKLYTDQGKPFVSSHPRRVCARLGLRLLPGKPYPSWSKGKIERVIQTIPQGFESTLRLEGNRARSLEELNPKLSAWIQTLYHQRAHSSTGVSPERRDQPAARTLRHLEAGLDLEPLFYIQLDRTVRQNGPVRLDNDLYEVPLSLRALKIQLRPDPWRRARIEVWPQGRLRGLARQAPLHLNAETKAYLPLVITQATLSAGGWFAVLLRKLGQNSSLHRSRNLDRLENALKELGRITPILVLDEAQQYGPGALEEMRLLLGLNLSRQPVFAWILLGDTYLQDTLRLQQHKALYSRISVPCQLAALDRVQIEPYLVHHLRQAGLDRPCLAVAAVDLLASASRGVPRLLNLLARAAWITAAQAAANTIGPEHVQTALEMVPAARDRLNP